MKGIIDFHTHAFPDELAERAIKSLEIEGDIRAFHDGRVSSLLASMDSSGIGTSVVCPIATKPSQFGPILSWSKKIASERIIPFPSVHPDDPDCLERISLIKREGFRGIKLHPFYQDFYLDEERLQLFYERVSGEDLILVVHTGFDIAFPRIRRADPEKILKVITRFPEMKFVATHLGAWEQWEEARDMLIGKEIYMEISCSLETLPKELAREMILSHPREYILFGTDSPWTGQAETLSALKNLELGDDMERLILWDNAIKLLGAA